MTRLESALGGGMDIEETLRLLAAKWKQDGGDDEGLRQAADLVKEAREAITGSLRSGIDEADPPLRRVPGIALAHGQISHFVEVERPMILQANRLQQMRADLLKMGLDYIEHNPEHLDVGMRFQYLQQALMTRVEELAASPTAMYLAMGQSGPMISHLLRVVLAVLHASGHDWDEIALVVDDGKGAAGRADRYRKLHESDPMKRIRHLASTVSE